MWTLRSDGEISVSNVESYRITKDVEVHPKGFGTVLGDIAYGGNWFFLTNTPRQQIMRSEIGNLTAMACAIRQAINEAGYPQVDHVEIFGTQREKLIHEISCCAPASNTIALPAGRERAPSLPALLRMESLLPTNHGSSREYWALHLLANIRGQTQPRIASNRPSEARHLSRLKPI